MALADVEPDPVAVAHEGDGSAVDCLRRDVSHAQAGRSAREPAVGKEQHIFAEPGALDRAGDGQHLAHPGAALGALVADHDGVALGDGAVLEGVQRGPLAVENPCGALEHVGVEAGRS